MSNKFHPRDLWLATNGNIGTRRINSAESVTSAWEAWQNEGYPAARPLAPAIETLANNTGRTISGRARWEEKPRAGCFRNPWFVYTAREFVTIENSIGSLSRCRRSHSWYLKRQKFKKKPSRDPRKVGYNCPSNAFP